MKMDHTGIIVGIIFAVVLSIIVCSIGWYFVNEGNRISSGVIVDKEYYPGHNYSSAHTDANGRTNYTRDNRPPQYQFCIEGEKNGEIVRYWFDVTADEYSQYRIGDTYER